MVKRLFSIDMDWLVVSTTLESCFINCIKWTFSTRPSAISYTKVIPIMFSTKTAPRRTMTYSHSHGHHGNPRKLVPSSQLHLDTSSSMGLLYFGANCSHTYMLNHVDPMIVPEIGPSRRSLPSPTSQSSSLDPTVWSLTLVRWNFDLFRVKLWRWVGQSNQMLIFTWFYMILQAFNGIKRPCARNNGLT